jgi:hypothetical protein
MPLWVIPVLVIFGGAFTVSGIAGMVLQKETRVEGPSKVSYRVVIGPSNLPWVSTLNMDAAWITLPFHWVRWLRQRPRMWSVTVTESKSWWVKPKLIIEECPTRRTALDRFNVVMDQIEDGQLIPSLATNDGGNAL